jgi:DNA-binding GntR family transcriptional regulator
MIRVNNRAETVKDAIREDIVSGALAFGDRLRIDALASRYGASHMPVREALRSLAGEGLVVARANKGARVVSVDPATIANLFSVRIALEVMLARQAAAAPKPYDLAAIEALEAERLALAQAGRFGEAVQTNQRFHRRIYEIPGNAEALAVLDRHWLLLAALWSRFGYRPERLGGVASDHDHIIRALRARDPEACGALTAAHVIKTRQDLLDLIAAIADGDS